MKRVYIISDGTGQSAINLLRAVLLQFPGHEVKFTLYSKVDTEAKLQAVLDHALIDQAFVAYTIVKKDIRQRIHQFCDEHNVLHYDILGSALGLLSNFLGAAPMELPGELRRVDERYFKRIEAIEYTMAHDDGKNFENIEDADLVILGLSRTSKTPTSFFLAQLGYKVVNIPLVPEIPIPEVLFTKVDQGKVVCLVMDADILQKIRSQRLKHYRTTSRYTDLTAIFNELEFVHELIRRNRRWHIVNTTNKSIEETAREIISAVYGRDLEM